MGYVNIEQNHLTDMANALREQYSTVTLYKITDIADAIDSLGITGVFTEEAMNYINELLSGDLVMNDITTLKSGAFNGYDLTSFSSNSVKTVGSSAFRYCRELKTVNIPSANDISYGIVSLCKKLEKLVVGKADAFNGWFGDYIDDNDYSSYSYFHEYFSNLNTIVIHNDVNVPEWKFTTINDDTYDYKIPKRFEATEENSAYIYVPRAMISKYQTATDITGQHPYYTSRECVFHNSNWKKYKYRAIEDYPDICG